MQRLECKKCGQVMIIEDNEELAECLHYTSGFYMLKSTHNLSKSEVMRT